MKDETGIQRWGTGWALPVSVGLHLLVAALLILDLPPLLAEPQEEEPVQVELVPPPEEKKPEPPPAPAEPEKPAEPEPPAEPEKPQEAATPPAEPEKPQEAAQPPSEQKAQPPAPPVLNPVVQFGERDAGPRQALDGNSAEEGAETQPPEPTQAEAPAEPPPSPEAQAETLPEPPAGPQDSAALGPDGLPAGEAEEAGTQVSLPETSAVPAPRPTLRAAASSQPPLQEAQRLFSQSATGTQVATTAMGNIPREVRAGRLCTTELREQLRAGSPPYFPDLLPTYPLEHGNVLDIPMAAFRVRGQWVDLSFRCTVDSQATRVMSFAHRVGMAIPRSEWAARGLPGG